MNIEDNVKIGDIVYGIMPLSTGYEIERVQITDEKIQIKDGEEVEYFEIDHIDRYGVSGILKSRIFYTKEEAIEYRKELLQRDADRFMAELESKENFFKYLYQSAVCDLENEVIGNFIIDKIKEYTKVDVTSIDED